MALAIPARSESDYLTWVGMNAGHPLIRSPKMTPRQQRDVQLTKPAFFFITNIHLYSIVALHGGMCSILLLPNRIFHFSRASKTPAIDVS